MVKQRQLQSELHPHLITVGRIRLSAFALLSALYFTYTETALSAATVEGNSSATTAETADPLMDFGISIIGVRRTAADYMLDFRYRIVDPDKAAVLMDRNIRPVLLHERTGHTLQVPVSEKIGPLRQAPNFVKAKRSYFMFFANPARIVKAGDKVTITIGEFKQEHIVVE